MGWTGGKHCIKNYVKKKKGNSLSVKKYNYSLKMITFNEPTLYKTINYNVQFF